MGTRARQDQQSWIDDCLILVRSEVAAWQDEFHSAHPAVKVTKIQRLTRGHVGTPTARALGLKAAETKYFFGLKGAIGVQGRAPRATLASRFYNFV